MPASSRNPAVSCGLREATDRSAPLPKRYPHGMGFNPLRKQVKRSSDYVMLALAFIVVALLLAWVIYPR